MDKCIYNDFIINNEDYIINFLLTNEKTDILKNMLHKLNLDIDTFKDENIKLKKQLSDMKQVIHLNDKMVGDHSMYKGEFQEKKIELILTEYFSKNFEIIGDKHMKCMDIRAKNKKNGYIIGIECKNKKNITKKDIDKFKSDKISNNFKASIFLSTVAPIKDYIDTLNSYKLINDELYIYSNDDIYIIMVLQQYINYIENDLKENIITIDKCIDHLTNLYNNWNNIKKCCIKMDIDIINYLNDIGLTIDNGHLFITSKNKCKNNKIPYQNNDKNNNENIDIKSRHINSNICKENLSTNSDIIIETERY